MNRTRIHQIAKLSALTVLSLTTIASAHPGHDTSSAASGFAHPFTGYDHLLAMLAVGLWSAQLGKRAIWILPASFLLAMCAGGALAATGMHLPIADQGILTSVLVLGILIATTARLPLALALTIVALFAVCHGFAHIAEMKPGASRFAYGSGFLLATASLHIAGLFIGSLLQKYKLPNLTRACGAVVACSAIALWFFA
jgi:urease accessory protein